MVSGVLHHTALGIHPGAFVQPTPPDTTIIQPNTLWVDTSAGEPYGLKCWDAVAGLWRQITATSSNAAVYGQAVLADNPMAYLPLDDHVGNAVDLSGDGHDGAPHGGIRYRYGVTPDGTGAMHFDGSSAYLALANPSAFPTGMHPFTQEAWFFSSDAHGDLLSWGPNIAEPFDFLSAPTLRILNHEFIDPYFYGGDMFLTVDDINNVWHHYVVTFDGTTRICYLDAVEIGRDTPTGLVVVNHLATIGCQTAFAPSEFFFGLISRVAIYDYALASTRVMNHATIGNAGDTIGATGMIDNCLIYPNGAKICNPSADLVTVQTPIGLWQLTPHALILPGGSRLEVITP